MEDFLNVTLKEMNTKCDFVRLSEEFLKAMRINRAIFGGRHAFRKSMNGINTRSIINVALFDIFSTEFAKWPEASTIAKAVEIRNAATIMLADPEFQDAISRSTNSLRNVKTRFRFIEKFIRPLLS